MKYENDDHPIYYFLTSSCQLEKVVTIKPPENGAFWFFTMLSEVASLQKNEMYIIRLYHKPTHTSLI